MRLTNKLFAQHLGWTFKKHWAVQGNRVPRDTGAAAELQRLGIQVKNVEDIVNPKTEPLWVDIVGNKVKKQREDSTHPNWHEQVCYVFGDSNVLLEGLAQAQVLTNTIEINGFPKHIEEAIAKQQLPVSVDRNIQYSIMSSNVFDAQQEKLPKVKLPERPAYNLPRVYGITHERKNRLLINHLLFECEKLAGRPISSRRKLIDQAYFKATATRENELIQFGITVDKLMTSSRPLEPVKGKYDGELPDLFPIRHTITIPKKNIYTEDTFYPLTPAVKCIHPHTIFLDFNKEKVGNLHELSVSGTQFQSRTMLKAFAVAAARAKQLYGESLCGALTKPIVVQSVQYDGRTFHFGVLQLNTLDLDSTSGLKNYWFHQTSLELFQECGYKTGRPHLEGYNKDVFRCLYAFYSNV